jgi:multicomponent Na+:H+ antiporter subunit D
MTNIPPAAIFILGALLVPLFKGKIKQGYLLLVPLLAFQRLLSISEGIHFTYRFLGYDLIFGRVDKLSMVFAYVFVIAAFIGIVYGLHVKNDGHHIAALTYVGSSLGVVFAGDYFSLFVFWEMMALSSVCLIWYRGGKAAIDAGFRYVLVHIFGGLCLFGGIVLHLIKTGSLEFGPLEGSGLSYYLILIGFIINAAVPPLHAWLADAYPEATITGAVFLSAFTTKTAVYVLIRAFSGAEILAWLGAVMAIYGVVYAVLENDIRRVLAYHIISQVGYMVAGVGIGTIMAINGASAHAVAHILYKGLLFMGTGAIIHMTGKRKLTELGGLYKTMPLTFIFYMIAGVSISAFPLFSGFVSKSMVVSAAGEAHMGAIWLMLTLASSGTFLSVGLKLPYFAFFGKDSGLKAKDPPLNMLIGMGLAAFLCIFIGIFPGVLYNILPLSGEYHPYTMGHVVWSFQILLFTALAFFLLLERVKPKEALNLDTDWFYRKGARACLRFLHLLVKSKAITSLDPVRFCREAARACLRFLYLLVESKAMISLDPVRFCKKGVKTFMELIINPWYQLGTRFEEIFLSSIPQPLSWFCKNPLGACKIATDTVLLYLTKRSNIEYIEQEKKRIEREREIYPGNIIKHWPIGSTVVWVTLFFLVYLLIFLTI